MTETLKNGFVRKFFAKLSFKKAEKKKLTQS